MLGVKVDVTYLIFLYVSHFSNTNIIVLETLNNSLLVNLSNS